MVSPPPRVLWQIALQIGPLPTRHALRRFAQSPQARLRSRVTAHIDEKGVAYSGAQPHAPTQIDSRRFAYDANGNQTGWTSEQNGSRRTLVWDEENRLRAVADNGRTQRYVYDASGERIFKWSAQGETAYVNQYFTVRNGTLASKHVFVGSSRLASTLVPGVKPVATTSISGPAGNTQAQSALRQPAFNAKFDTHPGQGRLKRSAQGTANAQDIYKNPNLVNGVLEALRAPTILSRNCTHLRRKDRGRSDRFHPP